MKKKKILAVIILFPWTAVIIPALALIDKFGHSLGICLGLQ